jgi:hypothetical protein
VSWSLRVAGRGAARFAGLVSAAAALTAGASLLLGTLLQESTTRAVSVGFYVVGSASVVVGCLHGLRGPTRTVDLESRPVILERARLRWATRQEQEEALASSALFVTLGVVLLVLGAILDSR